jgi:ADP-ribose pyrophosphatase YjhB (NUDIX family)
MSSSKTYMESLPKKRMGAGCLFFDEQGCVLLVRPTYKPNWEIPGGVVEYNESPKQCCQREVKEEIGLERRIGGLLVVDYNSPTAEKTESLMFIFDGGTLTSSEIESIQLRRDEISEFHFFTANTLPKEMTSTLRNRVLAAWQQATKGNGVYLENQEQT